MYTELEGIAIEGKFFKNKTALVFFKKEEQRVALVFGKNGSGKSTIAEAFSLLSSNGLNSELSASYIASQNTNTSALSTGIKVFSEHFVDKYIKIQEDGLGSIVLLGDAVDLDSQIHEAEKKRADSMLEKTQIEEGIPKGTKRKKNSSCSEFWKSKIELELKSNSGWAEWAAKIKAGKDVIARKETVNDVTITNIFSLVVKEPLDELVQERASLLASIVKSTHHVTTPAKVPTINTENYKSGLDNLKVLLSEKIEKPSSGVRETRILETISEGVFSTDTLKSKFSGTKDSYCPFCFRDISQTEMQEILDSIALVLDEKAQEHIGKLQSAKLDPAPSWDEQVYEELDPKLNGQILNATKTCNSQINALNNFLETKAANVFSPVNVQDTTFCESIKNLDALLNELEKKRFEFEQQCKDLESIRSAAKSANNKIAKKTLNNKHVQYEQCLQNEKNQQQKIASLEATVKTQDSEIMRLKSQQQNIDSAPKKINHALSIIFFDNNRLRLQLDENGKYQLYIRGEKVKPVSVSVGERNAIALAYFFTHIFIDKNLKSAHNEEYFLVIDDPVSSFDFENKIGVHTFIKGQMQKILAGNPESRIILMSHDWFTLDGVTKALKEILGKGKKYIVHYSLSDESLILLPKNELPNVYRLELKKMYGYGLSDETIENALDAEIGNIMRKALERFSSLHYACSIEDVSIREDIKLQLGEFGEYFSNLMYRLILHGESHSLDRIKAGQEYIPEELFSKGNKHKTAKQILCFMFLLNPLHILSYLTEQENKTNIEKWVLEIKDQQIPETEPKTTLDEAEVISPEIRFVPLYIMPMSAGIGVGEGTGETFRVPESIEPDENLGTIQVENTACDFAVRISGQSMEPEYFDSDIVLVKRQDADFINGQVVAVRVGGEMFCKAFTNEDGKIIFKSLNDKWPDIIPSEAAPISIQGVVLGKINN